MRRPLNIAVVILSGVIGAWLGYRLGAAAGWGTNTWPVSLQRDRGAVLVAFAMSVLFVAVAAVLVILIQGRGVRQALENGVPARATVLSIRKTGDRTTTADGTYDQVRCELEVKPRDGTPYRAHITQFLTEGYLQSLHPGERVQVRFDPAQRSRVAIIEPASRRK